MAWNLLPLTPEEQARHDALKLDYEQKNAAYKKAQADADAAGDAYLDFCQRHEVPGSNKYVHEQWASGSRESNFWKEAAISLCEAHGVDLRNRDAVKGFSASVYFGKVQYAGDHPVLRVWDESVRKGLAAVILFLSPVRPAGRA